MIDIALAAVLITATVSIGGSFLVARTQARSVEVAARDGDRRRIADLESKVDDLWARREADALVKRAQGDHIDVLEAHIWARLPPPPPGRPPGV